MLIDAHTHLDHSEENADDLIAGAREARVGLIVQSGIDLESSRYSVTAAETYPEVFASVGFHPQEAGLAVSGAMTEIERLTAHPRVVAVGETGFDFYHDNWPHDVQEAAFVEHIELARRAGLPVVIHTREAADVTLTVLEKHAEGLTVILHCFSLPQYLPLLVERGYYISFAGNVTYKSATDLQYSAMKVPRGRLLLETDAPWLTPVPYRGRPNRPANVAAVYEFVAGLRGVTLNELEAQVQENVFRAFPRITPAWRGA